MFEFNSHRKNETDEEISPTFKVFIQKKSEQRFAKTGFAFRKKETSRKEILKGQSGTKKNLRVTPFKFLENRGFESPVHMKNKGSLSNRSQSTSAKKLNPLITNSFIKFKAALLRIQTKNSETRECVKRTKVQINKRMVVIGKRYMD